MNIYREVVNRIEIPALPSLENGYYLLRFERNGTTSNVYAVVENESGMGVPITASVTEIGTGTPDPEAGEVLLAPGAWTLFFYEQVSGTNTNPDCSTIPLGQTEVTVYGEDAAVLSQTPTACPSGPGGGITSVNSDTGPAVQLDAVDIPSTPFVSLQAGTFPGAYRDTGFTVEGAPMYKLVGAAGDPDDGLNSIFRQTPTAWVITNATGLEMYNGTGADLLTATWTNTVDGALPLPTFVQIEADDVQAAVEEVASEVVARPKAISPTQHFVPRFDAAGNLVNTAIKTDAVAGGNPVWPGTLTIYAAGYSGDTLLFVGDGDVILGNNSQQYGHINDNFFAYKQLSGGDIIDILYYHFTDGFFVKHNVRGGELGRLIYTNGSYEVGIGDIDDREDGTKVLVDISNDAIEVKAANIGFFDKTPIARPEIPATPTAQDIADILVALGLATQAA
jgi:hypothetical protein